jgi:hypothetical protein
VHLAENCRLLNSVTFDSCSKLTATAVEALVEHSDQLRSASFKNIVAAEPEIWGQGALNAMHALEKRGVTTNHSLEEWVCKDCWEGTELVLNGKWTWGAKKVSEVGCDDYYCKGCDDYLCQYHATDQYALDYDAHCEDCRYARQENDSGCFAGDGLVATGARGERTCRVDALRPGSNVFSPALRRAVEVVATTRGLEEDKICTIKGLRLTHKHPIQLDGAGAWVFPKDVAKTTRPTQPLVVHNFVLAEGGTMRVNGMSVLTLGPKRPQGSVCAHPFYGSAQVIEHLKALPSWPNCSW